MLFRGIGIFSALLLSEVLGSTILTLFKNLVTKLLDLLTGKMRISLYVNTFPSTWELKRQNIFPKIFMYVMLIIRVKG